MSHEMIEAQRADSGQLSPTQIASWRQQGYALVSGLLPDELITQLADAARAAVPAPDSPTAKTMTDFGSSGELTFPSRIPGFNATTLHENLIRGVADLLNTAPENLRLTQSDLWPKYGHARASGPQDNQDQRIHVDYPNHNLAHPTPWDRPEAVELILYLSDFSVTGGATAVVPRVHSAAGSSQDNQSSNKQAEDAQDLTTRWPIVDSPGIGDLDYVNDRESAEAYLADRRPDLSPLRAQLYARERLTAFKPGDILFYRHDVWHRGTPLRPGALRLAHNMTYRLAHAEWINTLHVGWSWRAYAKDKFLERLIAQSSLLQRAVLGFPQPGNAYWCDETRRAVAARYKPFGMDMTPYESA